MRERVLEESELIQTKVVLRVEVFGIGVTQKLEQAAGNCFS